MQPILRAEIIKKLLSTGATCKWRDLLGKTFKACDLLGKTCKWRDLLGETCQWRDLLGEEMYTIPMMNRLIITKLRVR